MGGQIIDRNPSDCLISDPQSNIQKGSLLPALEGGQSKVGWIEDECAISRGNLV